MASEATQPALVVGVRTGGHVVAELMPRNADTGLLPITLRRASTAKKERSAVLRGVLARLPYSIGNLLRIAEHFVLNRLRSPRVVPRQFDPSEVTAIVEFLRGRERPYVLVVDDAVDSGVTLAAVVAELRGACPAASIKTAAITVTTSAPLIEPDFRLYTHVLCRFPWSFDFKQLSSVD